MPSRYHYAKCFDPYLRYAISTDFEGFELFEERRPGAPPFTLLLLAEFKESDAAKHANPETNFKNEMRNKGIPIEFGPRPANDTIRYATIRTLKSAVTHRDAIAIWDKYVSRVELSLPLQPSAPRLRRRKKPPHHLRGSRKFLICMMDDGCPFAAAQFLTANGGTRVLAIWDQNQGKQPIPVRDSSGSPCLFGETPQGFNFGLEFRRDSDPQGVPRRQMGLDEWIQVHSSQINGINEDACYADAGFIRLARRELHGPHVMDVLAGRIPTSSRIGPSDDRRDPPSWKVGTDPATTADVVFVQFPDNCIRDATGVWLKAYVVEGLRYILSIAEATNSENVIVNISYGPTTGPHDGSAVLEEALTALVEQFDGTDNKPNLHITLPVGNAYLAEEHVFFKRHQGQPGRIEWTWRLPPDNTVLCFAEVWMKTTQAGNATVTLTSPSGVSVPVAGPQTWGNDNTRWLLKVGPTAGGSHEHGDYTIKVTEIRNRAEVHAYVARTDPNLGVLTGAKRSYFVDPEWELTRSAEASCTRTDGEFDKSGSLVHRHGTLNAIATALDPSVHVAGGYIISNGRKSTYSSAGPARGGPRIGPDFLLPCDESYALQGIRAGATRSGAVFRLIGTSAAAPQLARWLTKLPLPAPTHVPPINNHPEREKRGGGDLASP